MRPTDEIVWQDYQRHETKQPEKTLEFLAAPRGATSGSRPDNCRMFITGSGGTTIAAQVGAKFVQEVTAVSLAVEKLHPEVYSVIELGGQDAKIIVFKEDAESGRKKKIPSMNDKCAGGTGAVIDKINAKLKIPAESWAIRATTDQAAQGRRQVRCVCRDRHQRPAEGRHAARRADGLAVRRHRAAEPHRAHARPHAATARAAARRSQHVHPRHARSVAARTSRRCGASAGSRSRRARRLQSLIKTPKNAQYFAALGAIEFGKDEDDDVGRYLGTAGPRALHQRRPARREGDVRRRRPEHVGRRARRRSRSSTRRRQFTPGRVHAGRRPCRAFIGVDGGSTSTKAVLISTRRRRPVQGLSALEGQPDSGHDRHVRRAARAGRGAQGATLEVLGVGTTGYAKDV